MKILTTLCALCFMGAVTAEAPATLDPPVKPTVTGKFIGNGKDAAIKFLLVQESEPFSDKEAIKLIFTEKDPATSKKPDFDASFGKLGSALVLSVHHDGGIFGCQVTHSAHKKQGFSSVGIIKMEGFKIAGGNVTGRVMTGKEMDFFGDKWEVDLTFAAPLPEKLRNPSASPPKPTVNAPVEPPMKEPKPPAGPLIAARKLPLPKDATDVEFKQLVKQIQFSCPRPVAAVTTEFAANLKQQGWKDGAGSLVGKTNSILKREQGDAELTVMIQPAAQGCTVKIFTEGLDWSAGDDVAPAAAEKPAKKPSAEDIEKKIDDAIQDTLRNLPKGFEP